MVYLDGWSSAASCSRVREQLCLDTPVHGAKEERGGIDRLGHGKDAMVGQNYGLVVAQSVGNSATLLVSQDDSSKPFVDGMVFVESAGILVDRLELTAQSRESLGWHRVAVARGYYVWTSLMHSNVNGEACRVDGMHVPRLDHLSRLIDQTEVFWLHVRKGHGMRVDPKMILQDGVSNSDMPSRSLIIVSVHTEPSESSRMVQLAPLALVFEGCKPGNPDLLDWLGLMTCNGMSTVSKHIERAVSASLLQSSCALGAGESRSVKRR